MGCAALEVCGHLVVQRLRKRLAIFSLALCELSSSNAWEEFQDDASHGAGLIACP